VAQLTDVAWPIGVCKHEERSGRASLVLRLLGREPDPVKSREHVLLSVLAERRLAAGQSAELGGLMDDVLDSPISEIGALSVDEKSERGRRSLWE